jgi:Phosphotransferase enzyme family
MAEVRIEASVERLLQGSSTREGWKTPDSLSGSRFERVTIDGEAYIVKYISVDDDWIMRGTGDLHCRQLTLLSSSVLDALPETIDHTVVACAPYTSTSGRRSAALLMRDVSPSLVAPGSDPIDPALHRQFLQHMAQMHAAYIGFEDTVGLFPAAHHYVFLTPLMARLETATARNDPVPPAVLEGWRWMDEHHPRQAGALRELARDPSPLLAALRSGPRTLVHGDWKLGNLGASGDRTILIDWDRCGEGPPLVDLAWYLAVNCDRLPESKEDAVSAYRRSLESEGVSTSPWWDDQLRAALAGAFLQLGWSKSGDDAEFGWWSDRLDEAALPL